MRDCVYSYREGKRSIRAILDNIYLVLEVCGRRQKRKKKLLGEGRRDSPSAFSKVKAKTYPLTMRSFTE